jgi:hypothetical protein
VAYPQSQYDIPGLFKGHFLACGRHDADYDGIPTADPDLNLTRAGLLRRADYAGNVGLRDAGGSAAHAFTRQKKQYQRDSSAAR